jgi:formamidopyrimidine-DNA glycosylase
VGELVNQGKDDVPELPEVEIVCRGLNEAFVGHRLTGVIRRFKQLRWPIPDDLEQLILGGAAAAPAGESDAFQAVVRANGAGLLRSVERRSKYLLLGFDTGTLLIHLGMSGTLRRMALGAPMSGAVVVGVGNIYASESLFRAGIRPTTAAGRIGAPRYERLAQAIRQTLTEAIAAGGSSLKDFVASTGESGYFQLQCFVYGREGLPCRVCGTPVRAIRQQQRATFYCHVCQRP